LRQTSRVRSVLVSVNRRLGALRFLNFPNENNFDGRVGYGVGNHVCLLSYASESVLIVGAGAFATEGARTALERGAQ